MGLSIAGFAFKPTALGVDEEEMIHRAFGSAFHAIQATDLDSRLTGNLAVESRNGAVFVYSSEMVEPYFFKEKAIAPSLLSALGNPEILVVFCHYDASNSYGYIIVENGTPTRYRLYTDDGTSDEGVPKEFELSWLQAEPFIEEEGEPPAYRNKQTGQISNEASITARLLDLVMQTSFGICPWHEWNYKTEFSCYQVR